MVIARVVKFVQSMDVNIHEIGDETLAPVLRHSTPHPYLACLVHQAPGHRGPLRPQQAEGGEGPDAALNEHLAPLIAPKMPEFIHQRSMGNVQGGELKHLLVAVENKEKEYPKISHILWSIMFVFPQIVFRQCRVEWSKGIDSAARLPELIILL